MKKLFCLIALAVLASPALAQVEFTTGPCRGKGIDGIAFCSTLGAQKNFGQTGVRADVVGLFNGASYGNDAQLSAVSAAATLALSDGLQLEAGPFAYDRKVEHRATQVCSGGNGVAQAFGGSANCVQQDAFTDRARGVAAYVGLSYRLPQQHMVAYTRFYGGPVRLFSVSLGLTF